MLEVAQIAPFTSVSQAKNRFAHGAILKWLCTEWQEEVVPRKGIEEAIAPFRGWAASDVQTLLADGSKVIGVSETKWSQEEKEFFETNQNILLHGERAQGALRQPEASAGIY